MKIAKRLLIAFLLLIVLFLGAAIAIPYFFKDELVAMAREEANKTVNAEVSFSDVNLSLIRSFPDFNLRIDSFSVVGKDVFEGVTLAKGTYAALTLDLMSVIRSSEPVALKSIHLEKPELNIFVLKDGTANYDIALPSEAPADTSGTEADYSNLVIQLASYSIAEGSLLYDDHSLDTYLEIKGLNHSGTGNFTVDIYDLDTQTDIESMTVAQSGITYLDAAKAQLDAIFNIDSPNSKYTLKDNQLTINALQLNADGFVQLDGDDINMELAFNSPQNEFRHLLSLIPNAFIEGYESVDATGKFTLEGNVSGTYNGTTEAYPAFNISTSISDGRVKYPDLPLGINNINTRANIKSPGSDFDDLLVDVPRFSMTLGNNPFEASFRLRTPISDPDVQAAAKGRIDLSELSQAFPIEGIEEMAGLIVADLNVDTRLSYIEQGAYEQVNMSGDLKVENLIYAAAGLPKVQIREASMGFTPQYVDLRSFQAQLGKSDLQGSGRIDNILAYFSPEKTMTGKLKASSTFFDAGEWVTDTETTSATVTDTTTAAADAEIFDRFDFELEADAKTIVYDSYTIKNAMVRGEIKPNLLRVDDAGAVIGESDFTGNGVITGFFDYLFEAGVLGGNLRLNSNRLNLNEFMPETTEATGEGDASSESYGVIPVPPNIDMEMMANIGHLTYTNIDLKNVSGHLVIANEAIILDDVRANGLGGELAMSGSYETTNPEEPGFSFKYDLSKLQFQEAFNTFNTFEKLAPIGKYIKGRFNSTLILDGKLGQDLYPKLSTINAEGFLQTIDAVLQQFKPLQAIGNSLQVQELKEAISIKNTKNWFEVKNGTLELKEYDARIAGIDMKIGGTYNVTDLMNMNIKAQVPREKLGNNALGAAANSGLKLLESQASKLGLNIGQSEFVNLGINLKGALEDPKVAVKLLGLDGKSGEDGGLVEQTKGQVKEEINQKVQEGKKAAEEAAQKAADSLRNLAKAQADQAAEDLKKQAEQAIKDQLGNKVDSATQKKVDEALDQVGGKATDKIKDNLDKFNPFKKKKNNGGGGGQ
ncbi:MAG: AsmA-like C-terminal region-containing protein [Phaeodactylibacter sp.]|uniref:AsmA-like C-terminal region-containing protein n=1 Tax=Phaeodactylibacter sp. TaxID=1940289 RepID=UPI0032EFEFA7